MNSSKGTAACCGPLPCSLLALAALLVFLLWSRAPITPEYVAVIDCGSSGTRIYVYTWKYADAQRGIPDLQLVPPSAAPDLLPKKSGTSSYNRVETLPGLDAFVERPEQDLEAVALGPLLTWARAVIPARQLPAVPLLLFATAGMRRLLPARQQLLMERTRNVLRRSGFRFEPSWARIISGTDEGVYGWIAINYIRGHLEGPTSLAAAHAAVAAARAGGTSAAAAVANAMGRRGGGGGGGGVAGGVAVGGMAAEALPPVLTVGSLDLGGSSLEMVYCSKAISLEEWRRQQRLAHFGILDIAQDVSDPNRQHAKSHGHHLERQQDSSSQRRRLQQLQVQQLRHKGQLEGQQQMQVQGGPLQHQQGQQFKGQRRNLLGRQISSRTGDGHKQRGEDPHVQERNRDVVLAVPDDGLPSRGLLLGPRFYTLRTHTFQKYGLNDAFDRSVTLLLLDTMAPQLQQHAPPPSPPAQQTGTLAAQREAQDQSHLTRDQDAQENAAGGAGAFAARPQRPALLRQGVSRPQSSPTQPPVATTQGSSVAATRAATSSGNGTLDVTSGGGKDSISLGGASHARPVPGNSDVLPQNIHIANQAAPAPLSPQRVASGEGVKPGAGLSSILEKQSASAGEPMASTATITGRGATAADGASAQATKQSAALLGSGTRQAAASGGSAGGTEDGTAAAKLRTQAAILEQQKRDSERIIQLVKEQLSGAQEHGGGGGQGAEVATTETAGAAHGAPSPSKAGTASIALLGTAKLAAAAAAAGGGRQSNVSDDAEVKKSVSPTLLSGASSGRGDGSSTLAANHGSEAGSVQGIGSGLAAAEHRLRDQHATRGAAEADGGGTANGKTSATGAAMGADAAAGGNGGSQASGRGAGAVGRALKARNANVSIITIADSNGPNTRIPERDGFLERGEARGDEWGRPVRGELELERLQAVKWSDGTSGDDGTASGSGHWIDGMALEDVAMDDSGAEESLTAMAIWEVQEGPDPAWEQDLGKESSPQKRRLAQRDLLTAAAAVATTVQEVAKAQKVSSEAEERAWRAAESSEKGLAEAAGLAAAVAAAAAKAAAGVNGSGVMVVGRDDVDVSRRGRQELVLRHPCMHEGFSKSYTRVHPYGILPDVSGLQLVGSPNWEACLTLVARTVNASAGCSGRHCVLGSAQPQLKGPFVALAGFYVVWTFFGLHGDESAEAVLRMAHTHCGRPWWEVDARLGHHINVEKYCMWGPYVAHLLTGGLGLTPDEFTIGSGDVGWPIGAALAEALSLPGMGPQLPLLPRLASRLLPTAWTKEGRTGSHGTSSTGGGHLEAWPFGFGLGWSLSLMWAAFLIMFLAWCSFYMAARAWLRSGSSSSGGLVTWRVGTGAGGALLQPLISGRSRQSPLRRPWLV